MTETIQSLPLIAQLAIIIVGGYFLEVGARGAARAVVLFAHLARLREFFVGFILLALATTIPEITIGVLALRDGLPTLPYGNLLGGIIILPSIVAGLVALTSRGVNVIRLLTMREIVALVAILVAPSLIALDGNVTRIEGFILILLYTCYITSVFRHEPHDFSDAVSLNRRRLLNDGARFIVGVIVLLVAASVVLAAAKGAALQLGAPPILIGLLLLAIGTNLPELTLSLVMHNKRKRSLIMGDILGSAAINVPTIGVIAILQPFTIPTMAPIILAIAATTIIGVTFAIVARTGRTIRRTEGALLFALGIGYVLLATLLIV
ncbi:MAG: hypothetical protein V1723_03800 [Candidatus Uhrbacteria bacterium]